MERKVSDGGPCGEQTGSRSFAIAESPHNGWTISTLETSAGIADVDPAETKVMHDMRLTLTGMDGYGIFWRTP